MLLQLPNWSLSTSVFEVDTRYVKSRCSDCGNCKRNKNKYGIQLYIHTWCMFDIFYDNTNRAFLKFINLKHVNHVYWQVFQVRIIWNIILILNYFILNSAVSIPNSFRFSSLMQFYISVFIFMNVITILSPFAHKIIFLYQFRYFVCHRYINSIDHIKMGCCGGNVA